MEPIKDLNYIRSPPYPPPLLSVKLFGHIQQEARRGRKNKKVSAAGKKKTPATEKEALLNISWPISLAASGYGSRQPNTTTLSLSRKRVCHSVWKSQKKSHSRLRAEGATFTFWVDKSSLKIQTSKCDILADFQTLWVCRRQVVDYLTKVSYHT